MARRDELQREIGRLEARLNQASNACVIDELSRVRHGLASRGDRKPAIELPDLRIGFACKQRWEDMVGDDRVRACNGCDRPVFNLSAMTREQAEAVLATRGLTPCVRFYRRPDGTVMTTDCPTGSAPQRRRLAVVASTFAAGGTLAAAPVVRAEPPPIESTASQAATPPDSTDDLQTADPPAGEPVTAEPVTRIDREVLMGIPLPGRTFDVAMGADAVMGVVVMGEIIVTSEKRPVVEWSTWGRLGIGAASQQPNVIARRLTPPMAESSSTWEAAVGADLTFGVARNGDVRVGAWGELRTSSGPVTGVELVIDHLPPHPYGSRIGGSGSLVLRAGGNAHVVTGALGFGYVGSFPRYDPWIRWARHVVGARVVASMNRSMDDPRDWSATVGLEVEPIGVVRAVLDLAKR
ncbi:MAG TPA: hypothetical protein VIV11_04925 [Kofleriaceae bacterium]